MEQGRCEGKSPFRGCELLSNRMAAAWCEQLGAKWMCEVDVFVMGWQRGS